MKIVTEINTLVNEIVWGLPAMICIVGAGIYLTIGTGFIQIRKFPYAIAQIFGRLFDRQKAGKGAISPFQAVCTALAGTIGTGSIAGVAGAIAIGGPGAVFWMWCSAFLGMCTKFAEVSLAVFYRSRGTGGELVGGPMYNIRNGLSHRWIWLICRRTRWPLRAKMPSGWARRCRCFGGICGTRWTQGSIS